MHDIVIQSSEWSSVNAVSNLQTFEFKRNQFLMSRQIMYGHCLTRTSWCRSYIFIMIVCILLATTRYYIYKFNFNFNNISKHEDIDEAYSNFKNSIIKTLDKHAPIKRRKHIPQPAPFMNKQLRQAIYKKRMLHNTFIKCKNDYNWERYRKQLIKLKNNP